MKVCTNCKHQKKYHHCCFGCMAIVESSEGMFLGTRKWYCDCYGWNKEGHNIKVLVPEPHTDTINITYTFT